VAPGAAASDRELAPRGRGEQLVARAMLELPGAAVLVFDPDLRIVMFHGGAAEGSLGGSGALEGRRAPDVLEPQWRGVGRLFARACAGGVARETWQSDDGTRHYLMRAAAIREQSGQLLGGVCLATDVSDLRGDGDRALRQSTARWFPSTAAARGTPLDIRDTSSARDALTGLPNGAGFGDGMSRILSHPPRARQRLALVYLGIDGMTAVNEQHGRTGGDQVLVICGRRMRSLLRADDLLARVEADEFVALVTGIQNPSDARVVTDHLHSMLAAPIPLAGGHEATVSMSIGLVMVEAQDSPEDTILRGRGAMARAKAAGGARTLFSDV
jgi:diguanylate cyclase (GGDEF)-like protein